MTQYLSMAMERLEVGDLCTTRDGDTWTLHEVMIVEADGTYKTKKLRKVKEEEAVNYRLVK